MATHVYIYFDNKDISVVVQKTNREVMRCKYKKELDVSHTDNMIELVGEHPLGVCMRVVQDLRADGLDIEWVDYGDSPDARYLEKKPKFLSGDERRLQSMRRAFVTERKKAFSARVAAAVQEPMHGLPHHFVEGIRFEDEDHKNMYIECISLLLCV